MWSLFFSLSVTKYDDYLAKCMIFSYDYTEHKINKYIKNIKHSKDCRYVSTLKILTKLMWCCYVISETGNTALSNKRDG